MPDSSARGSKFELVPLDTVLYFVWDPPQDYLDAMVGVCYDGVEGTLYLCLFSSLAACAFTVMLCAIPDRKSVV